MIARDLERLLAKYETIAHWRAARDAGGGVAPREALRALATEFPGALRQLETLAWPTLRARIDALRQVLQEPSDPARVESWMRLDAALHNALRRERNRNRRESPPPSSRSGAPAALDRALDTVADDFGLEPTHVAELLELRRRPRSR
jgi:hypothetical protein